MKKTAEKKPKSKRSKVKYPALTKKYNSRIKQEFLDQDYIHLLSEDEKTWLNKFMDEELNARFEKDEKNFNTSKEDRKRIYDANNARNRDLYGRVKTRVGNTKIIDVDKYANVVEEELSRGASKDGIEDALIEFIDYSKNHSIITPEKIEQDQADHKKTIDEIANSMMGAFLEVSDDLDEGSDDSSQGD